MLTTPKKKKKNYPLFYDVITIFVFIKFKVIHPLLLQKNSLKHLLNTSQPYENS